MPDFSRLVADDDVRIQGKQVLQLTAAVHRAHTDREAGYDEVFVHPIGADQEGFLRFYSEEMLPKV